MLCPRRHAWAYEHFRLEHGGTDATSGGAADSLIPQHRTPTAFGDEALATDSKNRRRPVH